MLRIEKIELKHLNKNIIGKYIKDSNKDTFYKVIDYINGEMEYEVILENKLENGGSVDDSTLLRDYDILVEEVSNE